MLRIIGCNSKYKWVTKTLKKVKLQGSDVHYRNETAETSEKHNEKNDLEKLSLPAYNWKQEKSGKHWITF